MEKLNPKVQAAISHFVAERDKALAELDIYVNNGVGVGDHANVTEGVIKLFEKLDHANSVIETIAKLANIPVDSMENTTNTDTKETENIKKNKE